MAGWDILQQPAQYHAPVAPEVPAPDNTAAKIISAGTDSAVNAFVRMAVQRNQAELERQKQVQDAALTLRAQDIAKENNKLDYEVGMANAKSLALSRVGIGSGGITDPKWRAQQSFLWRQQQDEIVKQRQMSVAALDHQAITEAHDLGLNDEKNWVNDPVGTLDKFMNWQGRYGNAVEGQIPGELNRMKTRADQLKIPVRVGATLKPEAYVKPDNAALGTKPRYVPPQWEHGELQHVPLSEFVQKWRYHPELRDELRTQLFAAGGNTQTIDRIEKGSPARIKTTNFMGMFPSKEIVDKGKPDTLVHRTDLNPDVKGMLQKAETGTFLKGENQVPEELTKPYKRGMDPFGGGDVIDQSNDLNNTAPLPEPQSPASSTPVEPPQLNFGATQTDRTLEQARRALAANPGARDEIRRRLAGLNINPDLLGA
jgi:hypothetical protein